MARSIAQHDAGWSAQISRATLTASTSTPVADAKLVVTDPINDVPAMRRDLEVDRGALWDRIRDLTGYDLTLDSAGTPPTS